MTIVLHIGLPKTGSSFLQEWQRLNRATLAANGINAVPMMAAHRIAVECLAGIIDLDRPDVRHILAATSLPDALAETRLPAHTTLISSEYLHHCEPTRLAAFLAAAGLDVRTVLGYVRRQDHLFASAYAQEVKALGRATPIGTPGYSDALNWTLLYSSWQTGFPQATVSLRNYETCRTSATLLQSFRTTLGADDIATDDAVTDHNPSLSAEMTEVARILNMRGQAFDPAILLDLQAAAPSVPFGLSPSLTRQLETLFSPSNRALAHSHPEEFAAYAEPGWKPAGEDLTDRLDAAHIRRILVRYDDRSGSQLARIIPPARIPCRWFRRLRDRPGTADPSRH